MKINPRVLIMREAITKIVPMLTQKNVQVTLRGMKAFVEFDPKTHEPIRVNLPYLPDDSSDELIDAVQGFLDHEVGHILFTDPAEILRGTKINKTVAFLHNAIEDPMIAEGKMKDRFTGSAYNLSNVSNFFLSKMVAPGLLVAQNEGDDKKVTAVLMVPAIRAWAGQPEFVDFMADKWHLIKQWTNSVGQDLIDAVPLVNSSADACDLAIKIFDRIGEEPPPPAEPSPSPSDEGESSPEESQPGEGPSDPAPGKPDPAPAEEPKGEGEEEGGGGEEDGAGTAEDSDDTAGEEGTEAKPTPTAQAVMNTEFRDDLIAAINDQKDFDASVAEALSERAQQECKNSDYIIFTRDDDRVEPMEYTPASTSRIAEMQDSVDDMLGPLTSQIERMISAKSAAVWVGGHKNGRLHGSALMGAKFGRVDLFRRKKENTTKDVAVQLVIDISGSMTQSEKITTACYTAYGIANILDRLGIKCEIVGFTTKRHSAQVLEDLAKDPKRAEYCRREALYMPVFKRFDERVTSEVRSRLVQATISHALCQSNVDGESVLIAYRRLAVRRETRKIMLVLSDGCPAVMGGGNLDTHLKAAVKQIEASGVDVVGLGIMDRSVSKFYKKHIIMKSVRDLPEVVAGQLKRMLVQ